MRPSGYRYANETLILIATFLVVSVLLIFSAGVSICAIPLLVLLFVAVSYWMNRSANQSLLQQGAQVTPQRAPALAHLVEQCRQRLVPGEVQVFVVPSRELNAYTFGLTQPQVIVVYNPLLQVMDEDELRFILGHEMGHICLGHSMLNTLLGGMAGVPVTLGAAVIFTLAFRLWNRACEYSADRAGLLACGKPSKAISALVKLVAGKVNSPAEMQNALRLIEQEDDTFLNQLGESLSTHPMIAKRIEKIRSYAASAEYQRLQAQVNRAAPLV